MNYLFNKFLLTVFILISSNINVFSDMIIYKGNNSNKVCNNATLQYINKKYTSFIYKGKTFQISTNLIIQAKKNGKLINLKPLQKDNATKKLVLSPAIKDIYPIKLAAYVLHSRYLFSATKQTKGWYYGKEVAVSGVVNLDNIKRITRRDLVDSRLTGKYLIPMLDGKINCIIQSLPKEIALAKNKGYKYLIMKFKGIIKKSNRYKEAFINNAQYVSSRVISYSLTWQKNKMSDQNLIYKSKLLVNCQQLKNWCRLDLYRDGRMGRLQCEMGADPEAYAMEIYWLRKLYKKYRNLRVTFSFPKDTDGISNNLSSVAILGWCRSFKRKKRL